MDQSKKEPRVLTLEEQIEAIVDKRIEEKLEPLKEEIRLHKEAMAGEQVSREWAENYTGVGYRQFERHGIERHKQGTKVTYSKLDIIEYAKSRRLPKAPELHLQIAS